MTLFEVIYKITWLIKKSKPLSFILFEVNLTSKKNYKNNIIHKEETNQVIRNEFLSKQQLNDDV